MSGHLSTSQPDAPTSRSRRNVMDRGCCDDRQLRFEDRLLFLFCEPRIVGLAAMTKPAGLKSIAPWKGSYLTLADLNTGHNIVATIFEECRSMYRANGPVEMRPVGEIEFVAGIAAMSASGGYGPIKAVPAAHRSSRRGPTDDDAYRHCPDSRVRDGHRLAFDVHSKAFHSLDYPRQPRRRVKRSARHQDRNCHVLEELTADTADQGFAQLRVVIAARNDQIGGEVGRAGEQDVGYRKSTPVTNSSRAVMLICLIP
jgi:hypothetical protein